MQDVMESISSCNSKGPKLSGDLGSFPKQSLNSLTTFFTCRFPIFLLPLNESRASMNRDFVLELKDFFTAC